MRILKFAVVVPLVLFSGIAAAQTTRNAAQSGSDIPPFPTCGHGPLGFILRQDFTDISLFDCPDSTTLKNAVGSRVTSTFDELAHTTQVSVDGLAAAVIKVPGNGVPVKAFIFGPYVQGSDASQFATASSPSKETETVTAGGFFEIGLNNGLAPGSLNTYGQTYLRVHGGETFGNSGIGSNTFVGEWIPVYQPWYIGTQRALPDGIIHYAFGPELMVQYDELEYGKNKYLLFETNREALRIGPDFVTKFWIEDCPYGGSLFCTVVKQTTLSVTYHASWDVYSSRRYSWVQPTLTYNFNEAGNVALSLSYGYGNSEVTANNTSQIKLGLAAKF
jgi:hypothetical protein